MKKFLSMLLTVCLLTACGSADTQDVTTTEQVEISEATTQESQTDQESTGSNILVAYFSRVGNTDFEEDVDAVTSASLNGEWGSLAGNAELLAGMAQEVTGGDLFLIETVDKYPSDYGKTTDVAAQEQDDNARPLLASHVENMDQYDTVILIYPNWWGTMPQAVSTFLEEYDFSGKTILPLCTNEGSGMGRSEEDIAEVVPDALLLEGLPVRGSAAADAREDVTEWIENSGIM